MDFFRLFSTCACLRTKGQKEDSYQAEFYDDYLDEKVAFLKDKPTEDNQPVSCSHSRVVSPNVDTEARKAVDRFVTTLLSADRITDDLKVTLRQPYEQHLMSQTFIPGLVTSRASWASFFAKILLGKIESLVRNRSKLVGALAQAVEKATAAAVEFMTEHPAFCTLVALGVLALIAPEILGLLGFGEEGIIAGSWAARWQSTYEGFVPKGSLFSFFQSLGTKFHWFSLLSSFP